MKRNIEKTGTFAGMLILLAIAFLFLPGCATENVKQALDNLDRDCVRHYAFALSSGGPAGVGASGTLTGTADCQPSGVKAPAPAPTPAAQ